MEIIARVEEQLPLHIDEYTDRNEWQGQDGRQHYSNDIRINSIARL